ncbi:MAG TPA: hypothetical protein VNQ53_14500 [Nocardioides sp.]|nr:hypothetical protein [Nocardioides sp.]
MGFTRVLKSRVVAVGAGAAVLALLAGGAGYAAGEITSKDIENDTIRSGDVKDGALKLRDLSGWTQESLQGQQGQAGTDGVSGYFAAAPGPNGYVVGTETVTVMCPGYENGRYALSGGVQHWGKAGPAPIIHESYPVSEFIDGEYVATGWKFTVTGGDTEQTKTGIAPWVVCAQIN